ncbi:MAG: mycothiol system anti-sigma-R factor [Microthrixaceae bacterium]
MTEQTRPNAATDGDHGDCEAAVAHLYDYLAGELDEDSMAKVTTHLERCSPCLEAFDFHAELKKVVAHRCSEQMPLELKAQLIEIVERGGGPSDVAEM